MRLLILALALMCITVRAAIFQQSFTTNSAGKTPNVLATSTNVLYPLMVLNPDGSGTDRSILYNEFIFMRGSNLFVNGAPVGGGSSTNIINEFYTTNLFFVSGKGNTLIITQALTLQALKTNIVATDSTGLFTNVIVGSGLAYDTSTRTLTATASGGGGVSTAVTALGLSTTNVTGFDCSTNNMTYTLTLAGHYLFGTSTFANLQNKTTNMFFTLGLQQDGTGGWVPKFTNSIVAWADGNQPVIRTNANAVSYLYFHTHLFTNGMLVGSPNIGVQ